MLQKLLSLKVPGEGGSQEIPAPSGIPTEGLSGSGGKILGLGIDILLIAAVILSFGYLLWGAFNWISSEGDKTKVESARRTITYAILGLLLCFISFFLVQFILKALGTDLFQLSL